MLRTQRLSSRSTARKAPSASASVWASGAASADGAREVSATAPESAVIRQRLPRELAHGGVNHLQLGEDAGHLGGVEVAVRLNGEQQDAKERSVHDDLKVRDANCLDD